MLHVTLLMPPFAIFQLSYINKWQGIANLRLPFALMIDMVCSWFVVFVFFWFLRH